MCFCVLAVTTQVQMLRASLSEVSGLFRDAGLKDICIEAGIVAEGSINEVLDGKHYNRAVRVHRCIYEALLRLA